MKYIFIYLITITFILASCNSQSFKTEAGTEVIYLTKGQGELPVDSLVCLFNIRYTTQEGKVIMEVDPQNLLPLKINPDNVGKQGELYEILSRLRTGDSVHFELVASELFSKSFQAEVPDSIPPESNIQFQVAFNSRITETDYYEMIEEKRKKLDEAQLEIDVKILDKYLTDNQIEAQQTESGLRYVLLEEGTGKKPKEGQIVQVNYAGRVLDGAYFDTSIESVAKQQGLYHKGKQYQPLAFQLGQGRVIKGWDEGIALLKAGTKAVLYIPSPLGYGRRGSRGIIKPNAILVFEVELVRIEE